MNERMNIGKAAAASGLTVKAVRFYENGGYLDTARRSEAGYRLFSSADVRKLRLIRRTRLLGVPLREVRQLLDEAYGADCSIFGEELLAVIDKREAEIDRQLAELQALKVDLELLRGHVRHCECAPGITMADCDYCSVIDEEGGDCVG